MGVRVLRWRDLRLAVRLAAAIQQTTAGASAAGDAAQELSRMATELQGLVGRYTR
jgi:methyl-accepting chemotaxis protein